jgi:primosomal protein N' (replication factor Y)
MSFGANDIVKVLVPNVINNGYDYRLTVPADIGDMVSVSVVNKVYTGLIIGRGDSNLAPDKIKPIIRKYDFSLPATTVQWIQKMAEWTMMPMGSVLKLIMSPADFEKKIRLSKSFIHEYSDSGNVSLNPEQQAAAESISLENFNVHVLDGITGSGKTQVYFDSVLRVYKTGKSVLLMMPEISLTAQFIGRFKDKFGSEPVIWHSNLTPAKRHAIWHGVLSGEVKIVVGTRSALFLPWQDLGLIIIDEEHDSSYKQEDMGLYHARDMAILLAKLSNFPVVLASATPSFETIKNVLTGKYKMSKLISRFNGAMLPGIEVVDMRKKK